MINSRDLNFADWLERRWVTPSYAGWLLLVLAVCLFGAATNSMAGWLYVISGISFALLIIAAILPWRSLRQLQLERFPIQPVSAGEDLTITLRLHNNHKEAKNLLQVWDVLPTGLGRPQGEAVELVAPKDFYQWSYFQPTHRRGVYHWQKLELRSGAPLGLFWCRRSQALPVKAIVYPQVLKLQQCPLVDAIGTEDQDKIQSDRHYQAATEGITKTLRAYRFGDPTRLIHWRSSARFDQFMVRELEVVTGGQELFIALDSASSWSAEIFEEAVIAAASLYFYAVRAQLNVRLWTAGAGLVAGGRSVLEALAAVQMEESNQHELPRRIPLLWITGRADSVQDLASYSRWLYFAPPGASASPHSALCAGLMVEVGKDLSQQLQRPPNFSPRIVS
ncbi:MULTISPECIES: DUF58 domain-containing protein [unclassified Synechocystis]|uniref:DUF58 domain-containing protein n=1 Tax=unclassified Synechocystis TaxID=2640012 RepID=UPI0002A5664E|nr:MULTISPECIES: DUF58 domain-containing protein [unclassified Synechocystis]UOO10537.1 DUF58 domain-containing protein [Synechocystis sp. PCC 6803]BAM54687.1 hypothetical protein BEST7613_5756 [Synechocystis sp. PCC 6803] [Bacillus subtilis BEST7613]